MCGLRVKLPISRITKSLMTLLGTALCYVFITESISAYVIPIQCIHIICPPAPRRLSRPLTLFTFTVTTECESNIKSNRYDFPTTTYTYTRYQRYRERL